MPEHTGTGANQKTFSDLFAGDRLSRFLRGTVLFVANAANGRNLVCRGPRTERVRNDHGHKDPRDGWYDQWFDL